MRLRRLKTLEQLKQKDKFKDSSKYCGNIEERTLRKKKYWVVSCLLEGDDYYCKDHAEARTLASIEETKGLLIQFMALLNGDRKQEAPA